jgi:hypothetical protein
MPAKLDALEHKLLASVNDGERPERVLEAVQAVRALRELRQEQKKLKQSWSAASVALTPVFAMLITAATLLIQTHENNRNAEFQQDQAESAAWRDTLSNVYLDDPNSVQMCLFSLQGFLDSRSRYASEARSIAVALLPLTANENGFDFIFSKLERQTTKSNQQDLFAIARKVRYQEEDLMAAVAKGSAGKPRVYKFYIPKSVFRCRPLLRHQVRSRHDDLESCMAVRVGD